MQQPSISPRISYALTQPPLWLSAAMPLRYTLAIPTRSGRLRAAALVYGAALLAWSSLEDNSVLPVSLLGGGLALIALAFWITGSYGGKTFAGRAALVAAALAGAAAGFASTLAVAALMLVKTGMHSHLFPDYPFGMMVEILERAPLWALVGSLAGIGLLLAWWAFRTRETT